MMIIPKTKKTILHPNEFQDYIEQHLEPLVSVPLVSVPLVSARKMTNNV